MNEMIDNPHAVQIREGNATMFTSNEVSYAEIIAVPVPDKTDTYQPLSNARQIGIIKRAFTEAGFELTGERYGLSCKGKRMVSMFHWDHADLVNKEMGLFSGSLNSYDKSTAAATALGARLFICENSVVSGDIRIVRRHTVNVLEEYEALVEDAVSQALPMFLDLSGEMDLLKEIELDQTKGYHLIGEAHGLWGVKTGFLSPTQVNSAVKAWKTPTHEEFEERNMWTWYQACNEALKSSPAHDILSRHSSLHRFAMKTAKGFSVES